MPPGHLMSEHVTCKMRVVPPGWKIICNAKGRTPGLKAYENCTRRGIGVHSIWRADGRRWCHVPPGVVFQSCYELLKMYLSPYSQANSWALLLQRMEHFYDIGRLLTASFLKIIQPLLTSRYNLVMTNGISDQTTFHSGSFQTKCNRLRKHY